jgi:hypothetical protein
MQDRGEVKQDAYHSIDTRHAGWVGFVEEVGVEPAADPRILGELLLQLFRIPHEVLREDVRRLRISGLEVGTRARLRSLGEAFRES